MPCYGVGGEEVAEEAGNVAEAVRLVAVDGAVVLFMRSAHYQQSRLVNENRTLSKLASNNSFHRRLMREKRSAIRP